MKNVKLIFLIVPSVLLSFLGCLTSCKKSEIPLDKIREIDKIPPEKQQLISQSRAWYEKQLFNAKKISSIDKAGTSSTVFIGNPDWNGVTLLNLDDLKMPGFTEFVRVPLVDYNVNISFTSRMNPEGYRDLLMRQESQDYYRLNIIEIHPDKAYLETRRKIKGNEEKPMRQLIKNEDFTGYFIVYSSQTNLVVYGERRENGIAISRLAPPTP